MGLSNNFMKVGVYVDAANIAGNGGYGMRFDVLREFACRGGGEPSRLNAYVTYDAARASWDGAYKSGQQRFYATLRDLGFKVIPKSVRWYEDDEGNRFGKANSDLDMAVDVLIQSDRLDRIVLATGDGDFVRVVQALQNKGCQVEVLGFHNVSSSLRREADMYISGFLIPGLLPTDSTADWGEIGSRVRGICYSHHEKGYGFIRFMNGLGNELWRTDSRADDSPYSSAFFHDSELPEDVRPEDLPSRKLVFEFDLAQKEGSDDLQAVNIELVQFKKREIKTDEPAEAFE